MGFQLSRLAYTTGFVPSFAVASVPNICRYSILQCCRTSRIFTGHRQVATGYTSKNAALGTTGRQYWIPTHIKGYRCVLPTKLAGFLPVHTVGISLRLMLVSHVYLQVIECAVVSMLLGYRLVHLVMDFCLLFQFSCICVLATQDMVCFPYFGCLFFSFLFFFFSFCQSLFLVMGVYFSQLLPFLVLSLLRNLIEHAVFQLLVLMFFFI